MNKIDLIIECMDEILNDELPSPEKMMTAYRYAHELKALVPVAHMYPSTLKDFEHGEKADYAYSIEMGNMKTGEVTVPLYALDEVKHD